MHEMGHCLVAEVQEPGSTDLVTINNYGSKAGGITSLTNDENYFANIKYMENRIRVLLAGKATIELLTNSVDIGATSDISRAFSIASRFVDNYCRYNFETFMGLNPGVNQTNKYDSKVAEVIDKYYQETKEIVASHQDFILEGAKLLEEKQYLITEDISKLRNTYLVA